MIFLPSTMLICGLLSYAALFGTTVARIGHSRAIPQGLVLGGLAFAVCFHGAWLYHTIETPEGQNLSIPNLLSMVTWLAAILLGITAMRRPMGNLFAALAPLAALTMAIQRVPHSPFLVDTGGDVGQLTHIFSSLLAMSFLSISVIQGSVVAFQHHRIHEHRQTESYWLPPIETMEHLLFQAVSFGFALLTVALLTGLPSARVNFYWMSQFFLSVAAWGALAVLLFGRWRYGWRGTRAVYLTLIGFSLLFFSYFGIRAII